MAEQMARDADVARHREASMPVGAVKRQAWTALRAQQRPYGRKDREEEGGAKGRETQ